MTQHETVQCPRCHALFECKVGSITLCQCAQATLTREQRAFVASQWDHCLCIDCLKAIQQQLPPDAR